MIINPRCEIQNTKIFLVLKTIWPNTISYNTIWIIAIPIRAFLKFLVYACFVLFQPHSQLCCFLGYRIEQKGYRCYDPIAKPLKISCHVAFFERKMFYILCNFMDSTSPTFSVDPFCKVVIYHYFVLAFIPCQIWL